MPKDIQQLYASLRTRSTAINEETYSDVRFKQIHDLKGDARELMLVLSNQYPDFKDNYGFYQGAPHFDFASKIVENNEKDGKTLWDNPDFDVLWQGFFPTNWEKETKRVWKRFTTQDKLYLFRGFLYNSTFAETSLVDWLDYVQYGIDFMQPLLHFIIEALDANEQPIVDKIKSIFQNEAENGGINNLLLSATLQSNQPDLWLIVKDLLLAAQRQEGLRQAIINQIHIAKFEAKILFIQTILEHGLLRFASVLGRLQWWFNLPLAEGVVSGEKEIERFGRLILEIYNTKNTDLQSIINNKNLTEKHFQLWVLRENDAKTFWKTIETMLESDDATQRAIALYSTSQLGRKSFEFAKKYCKNETDLVVCWNIFKNFNNVYGDETYDRADGSFEFFERLIQAIKGDELKNPKPQFAWDDYRFVKRDVAIFWIYRVARATNRYVDILPYEEHLPSQERGGLMNGHFQPIFDKISLNNGQKIDFQPTDFERNWIVRNLQDKTAYVYNFAFSLYKLLLPKTEELPILYGLLTRKSDDIRKSILEILSKQPDNELIISIETLINAKTEEQRLAGLDLVQQLKKQGRLSDFVQKTALAFKERKSIGSKAELILNDILHSENLIYDAANGYGLYDPTKRIAIPVLEMPTKGFFIEKMYGNPMFGLSISMEKLEMELKKLDALFIEHENHEYEIESYDKSKQKVLLGPSGYFQRTKQFAYNPSFEESLASLPLSEVWENWYKQSGLSNLDLYIINSFSKTYIYYEPNLTPKWIIEIIEKYGHDLNKILFNDNKLGLKYANHCNTLLSYLLDYSKMETQFFEIEIDFTLHYFMSIPTDKLEERFRQYEYMQEASSTWREVSTAYYANFQQWEGTPYALDTAPMNRQMSDELFKKYWTVYYWYFRNLDPKKYQGFACCREETAGRAHQLGLIDDNELFYLILETNIWAMVANNPTAYIQNVFKKYPIFKNFLAKAIPHLLEIELKRGETPTPTSKFATLITDIKGIDYFIKIIKGLGKDTLQRGYSYSTEAKNVLFSRFLKACLPKETDTYDDFKQALDDLKLTEKRLLQFALYAPQWLVWTEKYLNWDGLQSAAWCLHAHAHNYFDLQKESELAKYTNVSTQDFQDGAVDVAWFKEAAAALGEARFQAVYEAAHYICENQGYIRARIYADAVLGKMTLQDCKDKVNDKRNQNYVVAIGLVPTLLEKEKDVLERYQFLQNFKKQSKEFGQQRQASEKRVTELAMDNLARTAGYPDPIRLTWAMETLEVQQLMQKAQTLNLDNTSLELVVNDLGKAEVFATKNGKKLANIPPALKKNEDVAALIDIKNNLNAQHSRIKKSLEEAMIRGDVFEVKEIENLMLHPIIKPLLSSLVLGGTGFNPSENTVFDFYKNIPTEKTYRIAHCADLYASGKWSDFQKAAFQNQLVQPFKQIFREYYAPSADELAAVGVSKRYEGYKIQPIQAAALFRARGWSANYYEGVQKVFHAARVRVNVEVYADWFNPANSEPTDIHAIRFYHKNTGEPIEMVEKGHALSLQPSRIFSEIMRDLDLVVSVAHVGGVDIEASLSSIELRAVIVEETAKLFGLDNVTIEKSHVFIKGSRGEYTIHLGSGIAHVRPSKMLNINAVSTQQRGRIFLPFADEDPKTAEIVSKVLLLAKDKEIRDAGILEQIV